MIFIRAAVEGDVSLILAMLHASARDQGFADEVVVTEDDLRADGFGAHPRFNALIAEFDGSAAGMALYFFNYSTWGSRLGLYLEDLYVAAEFRRRGLAPAMMRRLARIAFDEGCGRFQWVVNRGNEHAIRMYESLGAKSLHEWMLMTVGAADISNLAD
ncbi:MAG: GNAT family N-acetyltransferase [Bryobacteraceae bacterium]|nr:GNAT family N-acetyltransferase [Bryobacteraceae bacterium]